ncbi:MAG: rhomboid family intramembrane serine protease [Polyangiales bacterium]
MIPLRDRNPTVDPPVVTWTLIALNGVVFLFQLLIGPAADQELVMQFGVIPKVLASGSVFVPAESHGTLEVLLTPFTSMFLHGGFAHVVGNMWFLYVFGDNVEDALGKLRYVVFYVASGLVAVLVQVLADPTSGLPMIGASGAISGVLAGYVALYPSARVVTLLPIFVFIQLIEVPAYLFIVVWFAMQLLSGLGSIGATTGGVAWWAHVGGFLAGLVLVRWLADPKRYADRVKARMPRYREFHDYD